jgi:spore maturation protein CgeD
MKEWPSVDVMLVSYQLGEYLGKAIASVEEQDYPDWHLTILDDGSTDPESQIVLAEAELAGHSVYRFWPSWEEREQTVRYAANINFGVSQTSGDVIAYLSADDFWLPERLWRMMRKIREGHHCVYGPQRLLNERGTELAVRPTIGPLDDACFKVDLNSVIHTRESFVRAGGWPTGPEDWLHADGMMWRRVHAAGFTFQAVDGDEPTDCKVYRADSVTHNMLAGRKPWDDGCGEAVEDRPSWLVTHGA